MSSRGGNSGGNATNRGFSALGFLNPERVPPLAPKWANKIGRTMESISIKYDVDGVTVEVEGLVGPSGEKITESETISLAEFQRRAGLFNQPSADEKLRSFKRKYELRLNLEFPTPGPASGNEADIQVFLDTLPMQRRRALLMSQKAFEKAYPEGFRA